jgi:predicted alpha/beta superfamily hydrolase
MEAEQVEHTLTGEIRTHEEFRSAYLEHERSVIVYLPPGYDAAGADRYPVLYLHDGQNVFDRATSVGEEWRADETAQALITEGRIRPLIMVGIYNTGEHRIDEYAPTAVAETGGGQADLYGRMLVEELKPFIDSTYRTLPGAASTAIGGSSLGGLLSVYLGLRYVTAFGGLVAMSPSVWWDDRFILRHVELLPGKRPLRIWLDAGTDEGEEVLDDARALRDAFVGKGWSRGEDLIYSEAAGGAHNEESWGARFGEVLQFLFPPEEKSPIAAGIGGSRQR